MSWNRRGPATGLAVFVSVSLGMAAESRAGLKLGGYDPLGAFSSARDLELEHIFVSWLEFDAHELLAEHRTAASRGRELLVTVEPFPRGARGSEAWVNLLGHIPEGAYNAEIDAICGAVGRLEGDPLVRWGHEMEDLSGRYPWAGHDGAAYVRAFRHFIERCRSAAPDALFVWSPMGDPSLVDYYPGDTYVDFIGVSVWAHQEWDRRHHDRERTLVEIIWEKYRLLDAYGKPIIIAEFGVYGENEYREMIFGGAPSLNELFPALRYIVYFNMREPHVWPEGFGSPDWRVDSSLFSVTPSGE